MVPFISETPTAKELEVTEMYERFKKLNMDFLKITRNNSLVIRVNFNRETVQINDEMFTSETDEIIHANPDPLDWATKMAYGPIEPKDLHEIFARYDSHRIYSREFIINELHIAFQSLLNAKYVEVTENDFPRS